MVEPRHAIAVLLSSLLIGLAGCAAPDKGPPSGAPTSVSNPVPTSALARLGNRALTEADFKCFLQANFSPERLEQIRSQPAARQAALEDWLDVQVQLAKARKEGIDRLPTFRKAAELMEMKLLVRQQMDVNRRQLVEPSGIPDQEIGAYYTSRSNLFQVPTGTSPGDRQPLNEVRNEIATRLASEKNEAFNRTFIEKVKQEFHFRETPEARPEVSLLDTQAVPTNAVIAFIGAVPIRESDFRWFLRDAFRAEQRVQVFSQPGARGQLLEGFLNLRLMEAQARKTGLGDTPEFKAELAQAVDRLLVEFLQEREGSAPWKLPGATDAERAAAFTAYMDKLRREMGLQILPAANTP